MVASVCWQNASWREAGSVRPGCSGGSGVVAQVRALVGSLCGWPGRAQPSLLTAVGQDLGLHWPVAEAGMPDLGEVSAYQQAASDFSRAKFRMNEEDILKCSDVVKYGTL